MTNSNISDSVCEAVTASGKAFQSFLQAHVHDRARLMNIIADHIEKLDDELIETTHRETHLPKGRLLNEKGRTVNQWRSYAEAIYSGVVLDIRIDAPVDEKSQGIPDIRKMMVPLGPVVIFGASNFPYAFATAGGDTASAIAGGNSVIVKAHPAHPETSALMAHAIRAGIEAAGYPKDLFIEVSGGVETGAELVMHPQVRAVGFTGSYQGGKALFDMAAKRKEPIPVFAEMGSINPLFLMPEKLKSHTPELAAQYIGSLTLGTGQFCTNPGVLVAIKGPGFDEFVGEAIKEIQKRPADKMLHNGIAHSYKENSFKMISHPDVKVLGEGEKGEDGTGQAVLAMTSAQAFLNNEHFCGEVFGPFGLIVACDNFQEMETIAAALEGQLTTTLLAEENEMKDYGALISKLREKCGRIIYNNFPTGVQVCLAMHHGGPFPSSTDSRFTSVGSDAIRRFMRPVSYQNWPESLLPAELRNENNLKLYRTINGVITNQPIS